MIDVPAAVQQEFGNALDAWASETLAALSRRFGLSEKGYNPDQPRDDHGRWGEGGGGVPSREDQAAAVGGIKDYLGMAAGVQERQSSPGAPQSREGFVLREGQAFTVDAHTYDGKCGTQHLC